METVAILLNTLLSLQPHSILTRSLTKHRTHPIWKGGLSPWKPL